jgi:hypothetical protein
MKHTLWTFCVLLSVALAASAPAIAQRQASNKDAKRSFRPTFSLSEAAAGKQAVRHDYQMLLTQSGAGNRIHTGEQVPEGTNPDHHSYQSTGTELACRLIESDNDSVTLNVALDATRAEEAAGVGTLPIIGSVGVQLQSKVLLGSKVTLAEFEDATSHVHYQLAVQAEKVE